MTTPATSSRVVLITGGSKGIGLATARRFAEAGHKVAVTYNSSPPPDGFMAVQCDVRSGESVDAAFTAVEETLGPVEIVVSNAGVTRDGLLLKMSEESFTDVLDANLTAAFRVAKRASKGMIRARHGRIIFVGSVVALLGSAGQANYAASKAGRTVRGGSVVAYRLRRRDRRRHRVPGFRRRRVHHRGRAARRWRPRHGTLNEKPHRESPTVYSLRSAEWRGQESPTWIRNYSLVSASAPSTF
jgi:NAD(P)-dependent dehydrogenase (short-subunit alcohol dehydrogenase family)